MGRPGVIWLGDLGTYRWSSRKGEQMLASMGLPAGPLTPPTVALPSPLVVFAETPEQLEQARPWLGSAPFTLVRPDRDDPDEAWLWEEALQHGPPVVLRGAEGLAVALDAALEHAGPELPEPAARPRRTMLPGGPWLDWPGGTTFQTPATRIARALRTSEDAVTLHEAGEALDLRTGTRVEREGPVDPERAGRGDWRRGTATFPGPAGHWVGADPYGRVAWSGMRCRYHWWLGSHGAARPWVPSEHDWPLGHAKKLWGYMDNDPVRFELAPDAERALSHYEHDVLLCGLPLRWRAMGDLLVAVRFSGPPNALFYVSDGVHPGDPRDPEDSDARHRAPVVALGGPTPDALYAVGFEASTFRLMAGSTPEHLGDDGWAVYDTSHQEVSRGFDRLLGGSAGALHTIDGGTLRRHARLLETEKTPVGEVDGAVPVGDRANIVLWRGTADALQVRLA
ncbi:MAG: hypothetical protein H6737_31385 [Alphaproteobacteria bacterium]|nr:hypothetical protein [Alphaproteobacteria bacterium]